MVRTAGRVERRGAINVFIRHANSDCWRTACVGRGWEGSEEQMSERGRRGRRSEVQWDDGAGLGESTELEALLQSVQYDFQVGGEEGSGTKIYRQFARCAGNEETM